MRIDGSTRTGSDGGDAARVFGIVHRSFGHAAHASGGAMERFYTIGGHAVRLSFAGTALVPFLTRALSHLETPACAAPALSICIWDSRSTRAEPPALPPWWWDAWTGRGEAHATHDGRIHSAVHATSLSMLDEALDVGLYWVRDPDELACAESGSPLLRILHWWMRGQGRQLIHGGAVGTREGGVILAGRGGAGKSTISLLSLDSDLLFAADDYCLISTEPSPFVHSIYCSGKVNRQDIGRFPFLRPALSNVAGPDTEKALYLLHDHFPRRLSKGFPVRAVLVPRVTGRRDTTLTRVPASAALLALAPSTIFQLPGAGAPALQTVGRLVAQVPSYVLDAGTDFEQIPGAILDLLSGR